MSLGRTSNLENKPSSTNGSIRAKPNASNTVVLTEDEITRMKLRADLITARKFLVDAASNENREKELQQMSQQRISKWPDNIKDLKKRKEEYRFRKFEKEELERRRIDEEERLYQESLKRYQVREANQKIFMNQYKVKALNSKLLYSDAVQERGNQLELKQQIKEMEKKREQIFNEQLIENVKKLEEEERRQKELEKEKNRQFYKDIRKQHKELKKKYIGMMKEEMEEGEFLRIKAEQAIKEEEQKEKERRQRETEAKIQANIISEQNRQLKVKELEKEKQMEAQIEEHRKKQDMAAYIRKKREKDKIEEKIKQREELYAKQLAETKNFKSKDEEIYNKQVEELKAKYEREEAKKRYTKERLKQQYEQSLKDQVEKHRVEKLMMEEEKRYFSNTWKSKLDELHSKEKEYENFMRDQRLKNKYFLKQQADERQKKREEDYLKELEEVEKQRAKRYSEDAQFNSYAEKCMKEWSYNGKSLYPMIRHLATFKEN